MSAETQQGSSGRSRRRSAPATLVARLVQLLLLGLAAYLVARLVYTVLTPAGPLGQPSGSGQLPVLESNFDPFFRLAAQSDSSQTVTSLPLRLHGTRIDGATGQGSAIIATPDGKQLSYAVGESIMPGVRLVLVGNDQVTIDRGGTREKLFIDQSVPAATPSLPPLPPLPQPVQQAAPTVVQIQAPLQAPAAVPLSPVNAVPTNQTEASGAPQ